MSNRELASVLRRGTPSTLGPAPQPTLGEKAVEATSSVMLPVTRRAPGTHGSSSSRQPTLWGPKALSFFPLCSQPGIFFSPTDLSSTGHNKEPVSQKHLLSAAAGRPVAEISWRFVRARNCFIALLRLPRRGAGKGCGPAARPAMKKASEGAGHGSMEVHQRLDRRRWSCKGGKTWGGQGKATGSCRGLRIASHLQEQPPWHKSSRGRKGWEAHFHSWLGRSWHLGNKNYISRYKHTK